MQDLQEQRLALISRLQAMDCDFCDSADEAIAAINELFAKMDAELDDAFKRGYDKGFEEGQFFMANPF